MKKPKRNSAEYGRAESNEWVIDTYKMEGGSFGVKLLEHWHHNLKHGLFEGFDEFGNKTFKDEYKQGLRIKHRTFDKTKTNLGAQGGLEPPRLAALDP